ncbi:MAG: hypothetical protein F6K39_08500 [Okeania sp. SIO3B3]|nr:hypothetical protein [Okeania sp. SIO3B3]
MMTFCQNIFKYNVSEVTEVHFFFFFSIPTEPELLLPTPYSLLPTPYKFCT